MSMQTRIRTCTRSSWFGFHPYCRGIPPCGIYLTLTYLYYDDCKFQEYNRMFFEGRLAGCEVKWSQRMTLCFQRRSGFCSIRLSAPLLKFRPRCDMVNTLLHEMIHAYVFVATPVRDHDDHGPLFQGHMNRINEAAQTKITVFHTFHDEVDSYRQHVWQCNGPCRRTPPYFGLVKRSMNRVPGPTDRWWADHEEKCGGRYSKIKEPAEFTAKQAKMKKRKLAREEKQKKQDEEAKMAPSVKEFFSLGSENVTSEKLGQKTTRGDEKALHGGKKAWREPGIAYDNNKKRPKERGGGSHKPGFPTHSFPFFAPSVLFADKDKDRCLLVGDNQALLKTSPSQLNNRTIHEGNQQEARGSLQCGEDTLAATARSSAVVVDLTVSDSDASDSERFRNTRSAAVSRTTAEGLETTRSGKPDIIEIE